MNLPSQNIVKTFAAVPVATTTIDLVLFGEMLGRKLWPNEYGEVLDYLFADNPSARATAKAAADVICERKLLEMEEEYEYSRSLISA